VKEIAILNSRFRSS